MVLCLGDKHRYFMNEDYLDPSKRGSELDKRLRPILPLIKGSYDDYNYANMNKMTEKQRKSGTEYGRRSKSTAVNSMIDNFEALIEYIDFVAPTDRYIVHIMRRPRDCKALQN